MGNNAACINSLGESLDTVLHNCSQELLKVKHLPVALSRLCGSVCWQGRAGRGGSSREKKKQDMWAAFIDMQRSREGLISLLPIPILLFFSKSIFFIIKWVLFKGIM